MKRNFLAACLAIGVSLGLTACDPPMPPDVLAQIAEQSYTCIEGEAQVSFPERMSDLTQGFVESVAAACGSDGMSLSPSLADAGSSIQITDQAPTCNAYLGVPFAVEAAVAVVQFADGYMVNLSPQTLVAILNGEITSWADERIAADNPDQLFPEEPVLVRKSADPMALSILGDWMKQRGSALDLESFSNVTDDSPLREGEIAIMPNSVAYTMGYFPVGIVLGVDDSGAQLLAYADSTGIPSGATKWAVARNPEAVSVTMKFEAKPLVVSGFDEAVTPYDAIYPVNLYLCGSDNKLDRAIAKFLLRLDSQGSLAASAYNPLSEAVRGEALVSVSEGLPQPSISPEE